ncbi:hypothetical protein N9W89_03760 [Hellea sp.]|nr:hypothetical protein [Hellea sp.]
MSEGLNQGERAIDNAPTLTLRNGRSCIPQHYLHYSHSLASVENIIADIEFSDRYPIFVSEKADSLILQIGIVGYDNYRSISKQTGPKIVFGRKWRVERNLPTSEIIQTAFLAIKKAREHEIRELFTLKLDGKTTTPFNNHHDLPLMARNAEILEKPARSDLSFKGSLDLVKFDNGHFSLLDTQNLRNGLAAVTLELNMPHPKMHPEFTSDPIVLLLKSMTPNALLQALIAELIARSDNYVDETFLYRGFARFSPGVDVTAIAQLSADLRQNPETLLGQESCNFVKDFEAERYDTDITRVPQLTDSLYSQKLHARLSEMKLSNFDMLLNAQQQKS